ncbi:MAG: SURF1 family protein, partial [Acidimicrobiia bacterium]
VVNRGWVPLDAEGPPVVGAEPVAGRVVVRDVIRKAQLKGRFGPTDPSDGVLERVARVDVPRLQQQSGLDLYPFYIELTEQDPAQPSGLPAALEVPVLSEGSHLSYAFQWFIFALVASFGYPVLLYRTARPRNRRG